MSLFVIHAYKDPVVGWCFDDVERDLHKEPLVMGADLVCESMAIAVGTPGKATIILRDYKLLWWDHITEPKISATLRETSPTGSFYLIDDTENEVWLCPALFKFWDVAPEHLYAVGFPGGV